MKQFIQKHRNIVGYVSASVALGIAILYFFIVPAAAASSDGIVRFILLYGHSICWLFLMSSALSYALNQPARLTARLAYLGLISYGIFMLTLAFAGR